MTRFSQVVEHLIDGDAGDGIEAGGGFIEKKDLRIVDQAAGDFNTAAHSAGEGLNLRAAPLDQVHGFKNLVDIVLPLDLGDAVELGVDAEVLLDGKVGVAGERLGNDADDAANGIGVFCHVVAGNRCTAAGDGHQRGHHADEGAFACAVGAEETEDLAVGDGEADALYSFKGAIALNDVLDGDGDGRLGGGMRTVAVDGRVGLAWLRLD